jgi:DNA-binding GntR family transcriptional regulator
MQNPGSDAGVFVSLSLQKIRFLAFGRYPDVTLADAFRRHADARAAVENGDDPRAAKAIDHVSKKCAHFR